MSRHQVEHNGQHQTDDGDKQDSDQHEGPGEVLQRHRSWLAFFNRRLLLLLLLLFAADDCALSELDGDAIFD